MMRESAWPIRVALAAMLAVALTAGCEDRVVIRAAPTIKIGAVLSLTGTYAALGAAEERALELEVDRVNAAGGIDGRKVELLIEDDSTDETRAAAAAARLIAEEGVVALIGASGTGQSMAMRGEVERAKVPQVSMAGGSAVTSKLSPEVFQTPWPNRIVVPFVLKRIAETGQTRLGLISDSGGYGRDGRQAIRDQVASYGLAIVSEQTFDPGDQDMTGQLSEIRDADADCILLWTAGMEAAIVARNREALGFDVPVFGGSGIARREFVEGAGTAAEGIEFGTGKGLLPEAYPAGSPNRRAIERFSASYEAAYGEPPDIFAGHAYDAINLVLRAIERLPESFTARELRDEIESTEGFVGYGGTFTFSPTDHNGLSADDLQIYRISNGKWEIVGE